MAFFFIYNVSLGRRTPRLSLHFIPFFVAFLGYMAITCYPAWRYYYYHEIYTGLYAVSCIIFVTYILIIGLRFHSGPNYCLRTFVKAGKKFLLPLSLVILSMGMMLIKQVRSGNIEAYTAFNLSFYILALLPIVRLSLRMSEKKRQQHPEYIFSEAVHSDTASGSHIEEVLTEVKPPFVIPKDLALGYRLEVENFIASRAYLDVDLNKNSFCERINIPKTHVSPFLKQAYNKNFNGFINELRLAYAAKELSREELVYTIDDLSFICGFRSRASFYRNFIAVFGCSPRQYRTTQLGMIR